MCSGYYSYATGYEPEFVGRDSFKGEIVRPQFWPENLDYTNKKVVVIGSGATAVTIVPVMAETAAHVTMLQRSPTYMASRPSEDAMANWLREKLPAKLAYSITRWRNVLFGMFFFNLARKRPETVKKNLIGMVRDTLGPDYDVDTHFTPKYNPWDQRLCLVPDNDLFDSINKGKSSVVTDHIDSFTPTGIKLKSGKELEADIIVTATGLKLELLGGLQVTVDGAPKNVSKSLSYKGIMYSDIPNMAQSFGYTNASWTLKADLTCDWVCRLLNFMSRKGYGEAVAINRDPTNTPEPWFDFSSGYVQRAKDVLPMQGSKKPWKQYQNYARDLVMLRFGKIDDGTMTFSKKPSAAANTDRVPALAAE
jgi:cation diffusion facilitator CzcD-associated flavoprotein CzcO